MLMLCSNGLSSGALIQSVRNSLRGGAVGALVVTADNVYKEKVDLYSPEMNLWHMTDFSGLSLTDIQILPHYSQFLQRFDHFEEKCSLYEKETKSKVIRLDDGDGVSIDDTVAIIHG